MKRKQRARTDFVRLPQLANLELLHASNLTHDYPTHIHEQLCVVLVHNGAETTTLRGVTYTAHPGSIFVLNPEELHSSISHEAEYRVFKVQPQEFRRIALEVLGGNSERHYFAPFLIHDSGMFDLLFHLYLKLEQNNSLLQQESELIAAMAILLARHSGNVNSYRNTPKEDHRVDLVRDYLKAEYNRNITLAQLTSLTNLDRFCLIRAFSNKVGVPPHEFQTQLRIAHARELIRKGCSISEVALQTGFFDQSHLSRHFKRIVGMTPGEYYSGCNFVQESNL